MNSKDWTRENGTPPEVDSPWSWGGLAMALVACVVMLGLGSVLDAHDEAADAELQALADAEMRQRTTDATPATLAQVRAAYEAGQADAMVALKEKPQGVALVQACLAMGAKAVQP